MSPESFTLKYPHTSMAERKVSSAMRPEVGWNELSGFSAVMRTAMQCDRSGAFSEKVKSMVSRPKRLRPYILRTSLMRCSGMPMATCS